MFTIVARCASTLVFLIFVVLGFASVTAYAQTPEPLPPAPPTSWSPPALAATTPAAAVTFDCTTVSEIPQTECAALVALYNSTNGPNWTNRAGWLATTTPCSWFQVMCAGGRVVKVELWLNNLSGTIPAELGNLTALQSLGLQGNGLTGALRPELGNLPALEFLGLWGNQLTGAIPPQWGNLTNLKWLWLSINQVNGAIPPQLGNLTNLLELTLDRNQLSGAIPTELGNLVNLQKLWLGNNQLSGAIPTQLGNLTNLQDLELGNNQLSGTIPTQLGNLVNLQEVWLGNNQLSGAIPPHLGNLSNLQDLQIYTNQLSGAIPVQLSNLAKLQYLGLSNNQLSGAIPTELGNLTPLRALWLGNNQLSGTIPPHLGNLANLQYLELGNNQLSGTIPPQLGNLTTLQVLWLGNNQLSGTIPPQLGNLANLQKLWLYSNQLSGAIPTELGNLANLQNLELDNNQLSGAIPTQLGNLTTLQKLWLHNNQVSGAIPTQLGSLINLQSLYLSNNQLSGVIPAQLGNLVNLQVLSLGNNQLNGAIPPQLGNLANLQYLRLGNNQLSGTIPIEIGQLRKLEELFLNNSLLSGPLPLTLSNLTNIVLFHFNNTNLCEPGGLLTWLATISDLQRTNLPCTTIAVTLPTNAAGAPNSQVTIPVLLPGAVDSHSIIAYDFRLTFNPAVLTFVSASTTGTLSNGWNVTPNSSTPGAVQVVAFNATALSGSGTLINLHFNVVGSAGSTTALTWTNFIFNEGSPAAQTSNGLFTVNAWRVGGSVSYRTTTRVMTGVTIALSGASQSQVTTTSSGAYSFTLQASGAHTVTPSLSGQVNSISAFDAAYVAQCVAGVRVTSDCPLLAADASGNNALSAFDAAQIAQYVAGLAAPNSRVGRWLFSPANRSYGVLTGDLLTEGYAAYLVGEVSGNWQAPAVTAAGAGATGPAPLLAASQDDRTVALGSAAPVSDLLAFQMTLHYDPTVGRLYAAQPAPALVAAGWELIVNEATPGVVELVAYGVTPVQDGRELVTLHFHDPAGQPVALTPTLRRVQFNEETFWLAASVTSPDAMTQRQFLPLIRD